MKIKKFISIFTSFIILFTSLNFWIYAEDIKIISPKDDEWNYQNSWTILLQLQEKADKLENKINTILKSIKVGRFWGGYDVISTWSKINTDKFKFSSNKSWSVILTPKPWILNKYNEYKYIITNKSLWNSDRGWSDFESWSSTWVKIF